MAKKNLRSFFLSIVLPSILAIALFILSIYTIIIPVFEKNMMDRKKEMIAELTNTAWSLLGEFNEEYKDSLYSLDVAKEKAAEKIRDIRYGKEKKDYFWIITMKPDMIMHPYKPELNGKNLDNYQDSEGKKLFMEAVKIVQNNKEGYIDYMWQWKDDSTRIVPKLSYVKGFAEWGWIVGTGIYLEDVNAEIKALEGKLIRISLLITLFVSIILLFIVRQSLKIEGRRRKAENKLKLSRRKYQSLVEASIDGTLMLQDGKIVFSNQKFNGMVDISASEVLEMKVNDIFDIDYRDFESKIKEQNKSYSFDTQLKSKGVIVRNVVVTATKIQFAGKDSLIVIVKDVSQQKKFEKEVVQLSEELQTSILLMNQPIKNFTQELIKCDMDTRVEDAAALMSKKRKSIVFVTQRNKILGVATDADFRRRVLGENAGLDTTIGQIMTAPVIAISENALLFEAQIAFAKEKISSLLVRNENGASIGMLQIQDLLNLQHNFLTFLMKEIELSEGIEELTEIYKRLPAIIQSIQESGGKIKNITRIITSLSDAITSRVVELAIESKGIPPCKFSFIAMGSEGRKEQTLATDQDNAIVYENVEEEKQEGVQRYFISLAANINKALDRIGYKYCNGDVMARNPKWNQPLEVWKNYFKDWINNSDPHGLLEASIFFDFRHIYGFEGFSQVIRAYIHTATEHKAVFFQHLAQPIIKYKTPVNLFGQFLSSSSSSEHTIDIKKILLPIVGFVRCYALRSQIDKTSTLNRLDGLLDKAVIDKALYNELLQAYNFLMNFRFKIQAKDIQYNNNPGNHAKSTDFTEIDKATLKKIFSTISALQSKLSFDFKGVAK